MRHRRRRVRRLLPDYKAGASKPDHEDPVFMHGVCRGRPECARRTFLWLPAKLCLNCLNREAARLLKQA